MPCLSKLPCLPKGLTLVAMTKGMTKEQISIFAFNKYNVEIVVKRSKTISEMLVELQAAIEASEK